MIFGASKSQPGFGLDIGFHSLKVAQIQHKGKTKVLVGLAELSVSEQFIGRTSIKEKEKLVRAIRQVMTEAKPNPIRSQGVITALGESLVFSKVIELPTTKAKEIAKTIPFETADFLPMPLEEVYFDWQMLNSSDKKANGKTEVLIAAAPKTIVDNLIEVIQNVGLEIIALETKAEATCRSLLPLSQKEPVIVVDIGAKITSLALWDNGHIRLTGTINTGGDAILETMATTINIPREELEKKDWTQLIKSQPPTIKNDIFGPVATEIADSVLQNIKFYQSRKEKEVVYERLILTGGTARLPYLQELLEEKTKLKVSIGNPLVNINHYPKDITQEKITQYAVAIGLALREE